MCFVSTSVTMPSSWTFAASKGYGRASECADARCTASPTYLLEEGAGEGGIGEAYVGCEGTQRGRSSARRTVCLHDDVVESVAMFNEALHHVNKVTT